ncbi:MAG TPA: GspE/PulE family protein [Candidatus Baltobacteraceae bacterium]|nr:GspE/PulE family protein [Candidatus Baltobacteraceae bacterium]
MSKLAPFTVEGAGVTATGYRAFESYDVASISPDADALRRVPRTLALRHDVLSLSSDGNQLTILIPDANDRDVIDRIRLVTGMHVKAFNAPRELIREKLSLAYPDAAITLKAEPHGDEAPAVRALDEIHDIAVQYNASDIHVEPANGGGRVRQRVDGILIESKTLTSEIFAQVVSRMKLLAGMDIADRRQPQDGRYAIERGDRSIEARVSSMPTLSGEKLVVRLLDHHARIPALESLGMPESALMRFRRVINAPHGFVLACGPTGSGKTTTLYAAMAERNVASQNLCSVEDPVEIRIPGVAQVQTNVRAGVTFASALRAFLRQDPNVIMVGEMRDAETAAVAASASLSGQLVLTTLHSNDAPKAIDRLVELGVARQTLAAGLSAIVAQRLVRRLCEECRSPFDISGYLAREFAVKNGLRAFRANGCRACSGTGYSGRLAIFECVLIDDAMRRCIAEGRSSVAFADHAGRTGYEPMLAEGVRRVLRGETTFEELRRVLVIEGAV